MLLYQTKENLKLKGCSNLNIHLDPCLYQETLARLFAGLPSLAAQTLMIVLILPYCVLQMWRAKKFIWKNMKE